MIAIETLALRLQALLARGLGSSGVAGAVGLAAASEVWGGDRPRERPAWYLWLRDDPGAWQLELAEGASSPFVLGRFTVRYYPSPGGPWFGCFSARERSLVESAFDRTGTPRIERASEIPRELFTVGALDWAFEPASGAVVLAMASLDRLRTPAAPAPFLRDVPGWALTMPVFSLLAGLIAQVEGRAASRLVMTRQASGSAGAPEAGRDAPLYGEALLALPPAAGEDGGVTARLLEALRDPDAEIACDLALVGHHPPHVAAAGPRLELPIPRAWFGGGRHVEDRIACAC